MLTELQTACRAHTARQPPGWRRPAFNPTLLGKSLREFPRHVRRQVVPVRLSTLKTECERCAAVVLKADLSMRRGWRVCPACAKGIL